MKIIKKLLDKTYIKENQLWVLNLDNIDLPFKIKERSLVYIMPKKFGGNHSHSRMEAFIGIGEGLEILWKEKGKLKREKMNPDDNIYLFVVYPHCPHVVINNSDKSAILIEFASDKQKEVEKEDLIKNIF